MNGLRGVVVAAAVLGSCGLGVAVVACSGSDGSAVGSQEDAGAGDGGSSEDAADGAPAYSLDDVCDQVAPKLCSARQPCCEETGGYDEAGCVAHSKAECAKDVSEVRAGREVFHPERVDPCLEKLKTLIDTCYVTFDLVLKVANEYRDCQVFEGSLADGAACERDSQCKPPSGPSEFVGCDGTTKVCKRTHLLAENDACTIADGLPDICGEGLYCDADLTLKPPSGTCKKATPIGQPCAKDEPFDLECGLGDYCEPSSGVCTKGKPAGSPCAGDLECASISCKGEDGGKTCAQTDPVVKTEECKGP
jgi:hypothetical protein